MFTIEHDHDETVTTVLDNDGKHEAASYTHLTLPTRRFV